MVYIPIMNAYSHLRHFTDLVKDKDIQCYRATFHLSCMPSNLRTTPTV